MSRPIRHYQRNFQGLDGRQSPLGLYYSEKASQSAELKEAVGTFRVFDFPLRNPTLELRYVDLPRVSAQKLADATDVSLLKALLSIALTETRAAIFPAPPVDTTENLQKKLSELAGSDAPPDIKFVDHFRFRLNHTGPLTAVKHVRNPKRLGRPGWFFLKDRKTSELLAAVGLHSVPSND